MSIQWMDNFQAYGSGLYTQGTPWTIYTNDTSWIVDDPDPTASSDSKCFEFLGGSFSGYINVNRFALPSPNQKIGVAFRLYLTNLPSNLNNAATLHFRTAANVSQYFVELQPNGALKIYNAVEGAYVADSVVPIVFPGSWIHLEFIIDIVTGEIEAYREGSAIDALTITDPDPPGIGTIGIVGFGAGRPGGGGGAWEGALGKDLVLYDGSGTQNNGQIGSVSVYTLMVDSDVSGGWTKSTGTSAFALLDEIPPVDSDYISASDALPTAERMGLESLPIDIVSVRGIMTFVRARKVDGGDAVVQMTLISNGDTDAGAAHAVSTSFSYYWDVSELDPDTSAAWTPTAVNLVDISINRTV